MTGNKGGTVSYTEREIIDAAGDLLYRAWGVIANVGPIEQAPDSASPGWSDAAIQWREDFHAWLRGPGSYAEKAAMGDVVYGEPGETLPPIPDDAYPPDSKPIPAWEWVDPCRGCGQVVPGWVLSHKNLDGRICDEGIRP